jgi:hypothetical protein
VKKTTRRPLLLLTLLAVALAATFAPGAAMAASPTTSAVGSGEGTGQFGRLAGYTPEGGMTVELMEAVPGAKAPKRLGTTRAGNDGHFALAFKGAEAAGVKYLLATRGASRLALALGEGAVPDGRQVAINERTTVAMGFAMAQFIDGGKVTGKNPGLKNAAAMTRDLTDTQGHDAKVLTSFPNGHSNSTLATFGSLANLLALCRHEGPGCRRLLALGGVPGGGRAHDTLAAVRNIARNPWQHVQGIYELSLAARQKGGAIGPSLGEGEKPSAWTLALSFEGSPPGLDGPGNFAIDGGGNLWVANNYAYDRRPKVPACSSDKLFRFTPTGQTYPGSPYVGGGLSGVGFGVTIDPRDRVWLGNFGFEGKGCKTEANHTSVSVFHLNGKAISPEGGWEVGKTSWPQGTISDQRGNVWLANCGNDSVTRVMPPGPLSPESEPPPALNIDQARIEAAGGPFARSFGDAVNANGEVWVTGNGSASVARLSASGKVLGVTTGGGLHLPLGIAGDSNGYMWVSNSKWVVAPCENGVPKKQASEEAGKGGGDVTLIKPNGKIAPGSPITGAGLNNPWGIAVDGDDHVWVANFGGQRLTELCGSDPHACPPGRRKIGAAISPRSGYGFDGLVRNTGVAIDPSGNVWLANNWKKVPIQSNPGGYQIVAYLGLGAPTAAPQIGPPKRP